METHSEYLIPLAEERYFDIYGFRRSLKMKVSRCQMETICG